MKKFLIPAIAAAVALSPVIVPAMFGPAPAYAQKAAKAAKGKAKNPMCAIGRPDTHAESWATAYGCWGQPAKLRVQPAYVAGPGFAPGPGYVGGPGYLGGPGYVGGPGYFGGPGVVGRPGVGARPAARRAAARKG